MKQGICSVKVIAVSYMSISLVHLSKKFSTKLFFSTFGFNILYLSTPRICMFNRLVPEDRVLVQVSSFDFSVNQYC